MVPKLVERKHTGPASESLRQEAKHESSSLEKMQQVGDPGLLPPRVQPSPPQQIYIKFFRKETFFSEKRWTGIFVSNELRFDQRARPSRVTLGSPNGHVGFDYL